MAQNESFANLSALNGLSSSEVKSFYRDEKGVCWIGTNNGLNYYDGRNIIHPYKSTLAKHFTKEGCFSIIPKSKTELWIATGKGLFTFNTITWKKKSVIVDSSNPKTEIKLVETQNRQLYIVQNNLLFERKNAVWKKINLPSGLTKEGLTTVQKKDKEHFFIGTFKGLWKKEGNNWRRVFIEKTKLLITDIRVEKDQLWVGTWGLGVYVQLTNKWQNFKPYHEERAEGVNNIVFQLSRNQNNLYAVTSHGVFQLKLINGKLTPRLFYVPKPASNRISYMFIDEHQSAFFCSPDGLYFRSKTQNYISPFSKPWEGSPSNYRVIGNSLFLAHWYSKGFKEISSTGAITNWNAVFHKPVSSDQITDIYLAGSKKLWVSSFNGVACFDKQSRKQIEIPTSIPTELPTNAIYSATDNNLWFAYYFDGLSCWDESRQTLKKWGKKALKNKQIWAITQLKSKHLLFASNNGFLYYKNGGFTHVENDKNGNKLGECNTFVHTKTGLWSISELGLVSIIEDQKKLQVSNIPIGSGQFVFKSITSDQKGRIWLLDDQNLWCYNPITKKQLQFEFSDLLPDHIKAQFLTFFNNRIILQSPTGNFQFLPEDLLQGEQDYPIHVFSFQANGKSINLSNEIQLDYKQNNIHIQFASPSLNKNFSTSYKYRLNRKSWINLNGEQSVLFSELPPGQYHLEIMQNGDLNLSNNKRISWTIVPPFWKTIPFYISCALIIVIVLFFMIRFWTKQRLKEQALKWKMEQQIQEERFRISKDMHDDIGSGLTGIHLLSGLLKNTSSEENRQELESVVHEIQSSSNDLIENMNQIVWSLHPENDKTIDLFAFLKSYIDQHTKTVFQHVNYRLQENIPEIVWTPELKRNIYLMIKEALNNAIKYSQSDELNFEISVEEDHIHFVMNDKGIGFSTAEITTHSFGLKNMRHRAAASHMKLEILSEPGIGTTIRLSIPYKTTNT